MISSLDYVVSYVQSQSGGNIPTGAATYVAAQVNGLIDALTAGTVVCCPHMPCLPTRAWRWKRPRPSCSWTPAPIRSASR
ncbi:MAG: hypothetical protein H6559_32140 [Lewinellaceae bacterium]|nr:hypothetical protein [Lewinellaceae bacterium]